MRLPAAARRAILLASASTVLGALILVSALFLHYREYTQGLDRAVTSAVGTVVETGIGSDDPGDIRVEWTDVTGGHHRSRFGVYGNYTRGDSFAVRYDPSDPDGKAFPGDPSETSRRDDLQVPMGLVSILAALTLVGWCLRWLWWLRAIARPGTRIPVRLLEGSFNGMTSTWVRGEDHGRRWWQQVMWDPAVEGPSSTEPAMVHGDVRRPRRVAVTLADGTALVPCGRLRHKRPRFNVMRERRPLDGALGDVLVVPKGAHVPRPNRLRRPMAYAAGGFVVGEALSLFAFDTSLPVGTATAAAFAAAAINAWAMSGGEG